MMRIIVTIVIIFMFSMPSHAVNPDEILENPALEKRARDISANLRCLVCQNQSIDDSDAELARDLRVIVRERLVSGDSDAEVMSYVVGRYGEYVLLRPTFSGKNLLLWGTPIFVLLIGGFAAFTYNRRHINSSGIELSEDEEARIAKLIDGTSDTTK